MGKKKPPKKKTQTDGASKKGDDAATSEKTRLAHRDVKTRCTAVRKFFAEYWLWFTKHKYEVLSGFLVAVVAVFIASLLTRYIEQMVRDKATKQMLNLVFLETEHNGIIVEQILNSYAEAKSVSIRLGRLDSSATTAAFQDANLLSFLSLERLAFLRTYINTIMGLNFAMQMHLRALESEGYETNSNVEKLRQAVHTNAVAVVAATVIMQEELEEYLDESTFDKENLKNIRDRFKFYKEKARKGEFSVSYE